jgi:DNA-binding LacI/PurR family transcriptional regulator
VRPRFTISTQIAQILRERLDEGEWTGWLPGEAALSRHLQVSRDTLRTALRQLQREGLVRISHGRPTQIIGNLTREKRETGSRIIRMITPRIERDSSAWFNCVIDELLLALQGTGYQLVLHTQASYFRRAPLKSVSNLVEQSSAACWILASVKAPVQRWFARKGIAAVVAGSNHPGVDLPSVDADFEAVAFHAVRSCVACGHRHIALLVPQSGLAGEETTRRAFLGAIESGAGDKVRLSVWQHDGTLPSIVGVLEKEFRSPSRPTALLVSRSGHALTAVTHLMRMRLRIPEDVAVIARDHEVMLESVSPALAYYHWPPADYARHLFRAVMQLARGRKLHKPQLRIPPRFHRGEMLPPRPHR